MNIDYGAVGAEDDEALDILWSMVMEEGNESAMKSLDGESAQTMLKSHAAFSAMLDLGEVSSAKDDMDAVVQTAIDDDIKQEKLMAIEEENLSKAMQMPLDPLPGIVDYTPESALIAADIWKQVKVVVSCSTPFPEKRENWERFLAVVKIKRRTRWSAELAVKEVELVHITPLNPYTCRCIIPLVGMPAGPRFLIMIETILPESKRNSAVGDMLRHAWAQSFQNMSNTGGKPLFSSSINNINSSMRLLTQISDGFFEVVDPNSTGMSMVHEDRSDSADTGSDVSPINDNSIEFNQQRKIFAPATNAAMAFVAAALTDFPNPGVAGAIPMMQLLPTSDGAIPTKQQRPISESQSSSTRKRLAGTDTDKIFHNNDLNEAAGDWANALSGDKLGETKIQSLDRYCKVRLVERLTNVIKETDFEATAQNTATKARVAEANPGAIPSESHNRNISTSTPMHSKGSDTKANDNAQRKANIGVPLHLRDGSSSDSEGVRIENVNLSDINEDQIDSLLDGLLVRIVENLMEMTSSATEMKDELNKADQSGFTLLHYACLYNLSSLLPILFFHGVSPDISTTQGNLTPLHLACSAGNLSIVELLVQKGSKILIQDSYGATALDHAIRNGYPEIARWLAAKAGLKHPSAKTNTTVLPSHPNSIDFDIINKEILMQNAFSSLSLKDKIMLNLLEEKERKKKEPDTMDTTEGDGNQDNEGCYQLFSKEERDGLAVAMKLMSKEELDEILQRTSCDMGKWILMRNYETLKHVEAISMDATALNITAMDTSKPIDAKAATKKKLDEAIAGLVLRKNLDFQNSTATAKR